ncbi:MAG: hypothetical protein GF398_07025 [Chitinivibrionales bacterium]|nr:hypothetical protein [Chitinivibrionales bacterium]
MSKRAYILFICFFLAIIYCVSIVQGIVEINRAKGSADEDAIPAIQFFDVFYDTFVKPVQRADKIAGMFDTLAVKLDEVETRLQEGRAFAQKLAEKKTTVVADTSADAEAGEPVEAQEWDYSDAEYAAEEAMFLVADINKIMTSVNRHITVEVDTYEVKEGNIGKLDNWSNGIVRSNAKDIYRLNKIRGRLDRFSKSVPDEKPTSLLDTFSVIQKQLQAFRKKYNKATPRQIPAMAAVTFFKHTWMSRRYLRAYEGELEETSVFANGLRPPMQFIRFTLLHDLGSKAVLGKNGWYFYRPGFEYLTYPHIRDRRSMPDTTTNIIDPSPVIIRDDPIGEIVKFKEQLADYGAELLVVIVPGKPTIYPDMISDRMKPEDAGKVTHSLDVIKLLREKGVDVVDLFGPFAEERRNDSLAGDSLYLSKDTHWRARGLRLASKLVGDRVKQYDWYEDGDVEYVMDSVMVDRDGDVGAMTTLPDFKIRELEMDFATEPTQCYQVYQVRRDTAGNEVSRTLYRDQHGRRSKILLLGDSFSRIYQTDDPRSAGWIAHLAMELSQPLSTIVSDGGASTLVRETLARKTKLLKGKKLVVWEFIERDLRFGAKGWKEVEL